MTKSMRSHSTVLNTASAQLSDLLLYRRSILTRARIAIGRAIAIIMTVYIVTIVFNILDIVHNGGWSKLSDTGVVTHALILDVIPSLVPQLRNAGLPALGVLGFSALLILIYPFVYAIQRKRLAVRHLREHEQFLQWWASKIPGVSLDELANPDTLQSWLQRELDQQAPRRIEKLRQIEEWFREDNLLESWTSYLIDRHSFLRVMLTSVALPATSVVIARLLLLLGGH